MALSKQTQYRRAAQRCALMGDDEGAAAFDRLADAEEIPSARSALEASVEAYLVKRVEALGGDVRKVSWPGRRGAPDRLVLVPAKEQPNGYVERWPHIVWVELKRPRGGKLSKHQEEEHALLRQYGQRVEVINTKEAVDALLAS